MRICLLLLVFAASLPAIADEGMWTFDNFPVSEIGRAHV